MKRGFLADLFCGIGNTFWDLARISSGVIISSVMLLAAYRSHLGQVPTLTEYADAMMKVFLGCAAFIGGKDLARAHATKASGGADT